MNYLIEKLKGGMVMGLLFIIVLIIFFLPYYAFEKAMDIQYKVHKKSDYSEEEFKRDRLFGGIAVGFIFVGLFGLIYAIGAR